MAGDAKAHFPIRVWTGCGHSGCQVAPARMLESDTGVERASASAAYQNGDIYLRLVSGSPQYGLTIVTRISDGQTIAAVQQRSRLSTCGVAGGASGSPFLFPFVGSDSDLGLLVGHFDPVGGAFVWPPKWLPVHDIHTTTFGNDEFWGMGFVDGSVRVASSFLATSLIDVDHGVASATSSFGIDHVAFWSLPEGSPGYSDIRMYVPPSGTGLLARLPNTHLLTVAASERAIVWIGTQGPRVFDGSFDSAKLYWSPRVARAEDAVVTEGPSLPGANDLLTLETAGDFAVTRSCVTPDALTCRVLVVQLSAKRVWQIPNRPGSLFIEVLALSEKEILLTEIDWPSGARYLQEIQRLVRINLANLDSYDGGI
jgi:hypothetical protein